MIRKLNVTTAILLVACLALAPAAYAAEGPTVPTSPFAFFGELIDLVVDWVKGFGGPPPPAGKPVGDIQTLAQCEPGGESGPFVDPNGPGC